MIDMSEESDLLTKVRRRPDCIRCGVCCLSGACSAGNEQDSTNGFCMFLQINKDNTSCLLLVNGVVKPEDIDINNGCALRNFPEVYEYYSSKYVKFLSEERI